MFSMFLHVENVIGIRNSNYDQGFKRGVRLPVAYQVSISTIG